MTKKSRVLNSDELGRYGEGKFVTLCDGARLVANKSTVDRAGWDYIVDFPADEKYLSGLVDKANPYSCLFQCKALWDDRNTISVRLSSLARLAKDSRPTFMYIMKFDQKLCVSGAYIIHFLDDKLSLVLERLHLHQVRQGPPINKIYLNFNILEIAEEIEFNSAALVDFIEAAVGGDINAYIENKITQFRELGYAPNSAAMTFNVDGSNFENLVEGILGFSTSFNVTEVMLSTTRFGVPQVMSEIPSSGLMTVGPTNGRKCSIIVKDDESKIRARMNGLLYILPKILQSEDHPILSVHTDFSNFKVGRNKIQHKTSFDEVGSKSAPLNVWQEHIKMSLQIVSGKTQISVKSMYGSPVVFYVGKKNVEKKSALEDNLKILNIVEKLFEISGVDIDTAINYEQVIDFAKNYEFLKRIVAGDSSDLTLFLEQREGIDVEVAKKDIKWIKYFRAGDKLIVMQFTADCDVLQDNNYLCIKSLAGTVKIQDIDVFYIAEYVSFIDGYADINAPQFFIAQPPPSS